MACIGSNPAKATVLVVDDSPEIQHYFRAVLELDSYRVEIASSGPEALQYLRRGPFPQIVLLDLQMPGMDGLETLRRLQEFCPMPKVIMCSGVNDPHKIRQALSLGAYAYLLKPVRHLYLSAAIERCLHEPSPERPAEPLGAQLFLLPSPNQFERTTRSSGFKSSVEPYPRGIA